MERRSWIDKAVERLRAGIPEREPLFREEDRSDPAFAEDARDYEAVWKLTQRYRSGFQPDAAAGLGKLKQRLRARRRARQRRLYLVGGIAASLLLLIAFLLGGDLDLPSAADRPVVVEAGDAPEELSLPDGTVVALNRHSKLTYAAGEGALSAPLSLEGEAFFQVAPQKEGAFVVRAEGVEVKVLGTAFNLRAFPGESTTELEVEEGRVSFRSVGSGETVVVGPMERAVLERGELSLERRRPTLLSRAWREEALQFRDTPVREVIATLERYYGIRLALASDSLGSCLFTHPPFRREEAEDLLTAMESVFGAELVPLGPGAFRLEGGSCESGQ